MRDFESITKWLHILVATMAVWSQDRVEEVFARLDIANYSLAGTVILAIVGIQASDRIALTAIDRLRWIRRILGGSNDIEGDWVNVVVDTAAPTTIIAAEYCRIRYHGGKYVLSGDTWDLDGRWIGDFATAGGITYQGRELEYYYKAGLHRVGGFGVIIFSPNDSKPTDFICRYVDEGLSTPHVTRGQRISSRLRRVPLEARKESALRFAENFDRAGLLNLDRALGKNAP